ncbi:hypothetical protein [Paenibacillus borealis]|nr:hypothetical protein [Paenibacillus borealis]
MPASTNIPLCKQEKPELKAKMGAKHADFAISSGFACITSYTLSAEIMKL